ncbi:endosulfine alpha [Rhinolophus ferrumequinum]|uniref:Copper transport protein ATOX1 n=1 Tax=Rhinolophus ferrumequinum TaxID=59479 RepID=A0A7J7SWE1_RHIFE|nr:endosulfine alpha [Rhinolophus ferrumequinum]
MAQPRSDIKLILCRNIYVFHWRCSVRTIRKSPERGEASPPLPPPTVTSSVMPKHEFTVDMTCEGCSSAVTRVLNKLGGVQFEIDLPSKKVSIESEYSVDTLLETLRKTGKTVTHLGPS